MSLSKLIYNIFRRKNVAQKCVIFKELPKVNNCPLGENSPHLVTLLASYGRVKLDFGSREERS
jgi:hypothetical protein